MQPLHQAKRLLLHSEMEKRNPQGQEAPDVAHVQSNPQSGWYRIAWLLSRNRLVSEGSTNKQKQYLEGVLEVSELLALASALDELPREPPAHTGMLGPTAQMKSRLPLCEVCSPPPKT